MKKSPFLFASVFLVACGGNAGRTDSKPSPAPNPDGSSGSISSTASKPHKVTVYDTVEGRLVISTILVGESGVASITPLSPILNNVSYETDCGVSVSENSGNFEFDIAEAKSDCSFYVTYASVLPDTKIVEVNAFGGVIGGFVHETRYSVSEGKSLSIPYNIDDGYQARISGCDGIQDDDAYVISSVTEDCKVDFYIESNANDSQKVVVGYVGPGKAWPLSTSVKSGDSSIVYTEPSYGFKPVLWWQSPECGYVTENPDNSFTVESVTKPCELAIHFEKANPNDHLVHQLVTWVPQEEIKTTITILDTANAPVYQTYAVPDSIPFTVNIDHNPKYEVRDVVGCNNTHYKGDIDKFDMLGLTTDCNIDINFSPEPTTKSARYFNITAEVLPAEFGKLFTDKIKVHAGTSAQFQIETHPDYFVESITGCDTLHVNTLNDGVTVFNTGSIHKQCQIIAKVEKKQFSKPAKPLLIAHAGGAYLRNTYLNTMEALNDNYAIGHRYFELDFDWTTDNKLVSIHDWEGTYARLFVGAVNGATPDFETFISKRMINNMTQISLGRLSKWLDEHPDSYIVTDIKGDNIAGLRVMKTELGNNFKRVIPQIYQPNEYVGAKLLGFDNIIFTLYATSASTDKIIETIKSYDLFGITLPTFRSDLQKIVEVSKAEGKFVYVHTFNEVSDFDHYKKLGIDGLYTDYLYPNAQGEILRKK